MKATLEKSRISAGKYTIPLSIVCDRNVSIFETIVEYLKDHHGLTYHEIAVLLNRDDRTIWTVYNRAAKKRAKGMQK
jgi:hypothetical protein